MNAGIDMKTTPLVHAPPGFVSNFIDPPNRTAMIVISTSVCISVTTIFVALRCYTRLMLTTSTFGTSDYMFLLGYAVAIGNTALTISATHYGLGRRPWDISLEMFFPNLTRNLWGEKKTYALSLTFTKIAILLLYPQLNPNRIFRIWVYVLISAVSIMWLAVFLLDLFLCWPIKDYWFWSPHVKKCNATIPYVAFTGAMNISTDLAILIYPIVILRRIVLPTKEKIAVSLILATGSFASLISLIRILISFNVLGLHDPIYVATKLVLWSNAEMNAGIICASLPTLRPFIRKFFPALLTSSSANESSAKKGFVVLDERGHMTRYELKSLHPTKGENRVSKVEQVHGSENVNEEHILSNEPSNPAWDGTAEKGENVGTKISV